MRPRLALVALCLGLAPAWSAETSLPTPVTTPAPTYPAELEDSGRSGRAVIATTITPAGRAARARVHEADHPAFGRAALAVLRDWRFEPARRDGEAVEVAVLIPFDFRAPVDQQFNALLGRKVFQHLPPETEVVEETELRRRLRPSNRMPPVLPTSLQDEKFKDIILVSCIVTPEGLVINPELLELPADRRLAGPALMTAALTRFPPPLHQRQPVYARTTLRVDFSQKPMPMDFAYWEMVDNEGTPFASGATGDVAPSIAPYTGQGL
jgi:TonB family protein